MKKINIDSKKELELVFANMSTAKQRSAYKELVNAGMQDEAIDFMRKTIFMWMARK